MSISTIIVLIIAALLVAAVHYLVKHGMCAACEDRKACQAAKEASDPDSAPSCCEKCSACQYHDELNVLHAKH